jgi:hypothetical protein
MAYWREIHIIIITIIINDLVGSVELAVTVRRPQWCHSTGEMRGDIVSIFNFHCFIAAPCRQLLGVRHCDSVVIIAVVRGCRRRLTAEWYFLQLHCLPRCTSVPLLLLPSIAADPTTTVLPLLRCIA